MKHQTPQPCTQSLEGELHKEIQIAVDPNLDEANLDGERKILTVIIVERKVISRRIVEHRRKIPAQESAHVTEEAGDAMILSINSPIESWILDSGASFHATPCQEIMEKYVSGDFGKVHLADDETLKIVGKGDIRLKLPNQTTWKLQGVRHVPGLRRYLISVGQLDGEGYCTTFSGHEWKITKGALIIARGKKTSTLYVTSNLENIVAVVDADGKSNLWHQRLGHMSEKGMKTLLSKGKLPDLKNINVGLCEDCIFGK